VKRSITIAGHRTSVSIEDDFWAALGEIAEARGMSSTALIAAIDQARGDANLSSAIRSTVLAWYRERTPKAGD
jgi:predicted DNA-binding ribbon-helix-helix protein